MKNLILFFLAFFTLSNVSGQTDKNGNPVFNSVIISEEKFDNFELTTSYYTIKDNISNKNSSVYVNDNPSLDDYIKFARNLPSACFIVHKGQTVICMILLLQKNDNNKTVLTYLVLNPDTEKKITIPCNTWGEISEKRADELLSLGVDAASRRMDFPNNGKALVFDGIAYRIQSFEKLKTEVLEIAKQVNSAGK